MLLIIINLLKTYNKHINPLLDDAYYIITIFSNIYFLDIPEYDLFKTYNMDCLLHKSLSLNYLKYIHRLSIILYLNS